MRHLVFAMVGIVLLGASSPVAAAPSSSPAPSQSSASPEAAAIAIARSRIDTMLRTGHADPAWFSASFLAQVPASKVDAVIAGLESQLGAYQRLEFTPAKFTAHFAKGTDDVLIHLDSADKIDGLLFRPPVMKT